MPVSKKPRKRPHTYPARATSTPFLHVELRVRMAIEHLRRGSGFEASHFDHLAFAQRLTCLLKAKEEEAQVLNAMVETLRLMRQDYRQTGAMKAGEKYLAALLAGVCTMEAIWIRYPARYLESCYDKEMLALYQETTELIEKVTASTDAPSIKGIDASVVDIA